MNEEIKDAYSCVFLVAIAVCLALMIIWGGIKLFDDTQRMSDIQRIEQKLLNNCSWKAKNTHDYVQCVSGVQKVIDEYDTDQKVEEDN